MIIDAIKENMNTNEIIVISDIDIIFYKPVIPTIKRHMLNHDICFQKEYPRKGINIGLYTSSLKIDISLYIMININFFILLIFFHPIYLSYKYIHYLQHIIY